MIDPSISLAMTLQSNKGAYAVLLGSGVSRSASIPTGWEVTIELIRRVASLAGDEISGAPEVWYKEKFGKDPDYSILIDQIAKTPTERAHLLREFFEPNEDERKAGLKQPTTAHRALAALVSRGYIRVIITTNFDSLVEQALSELGVPYHVAASSDAVDGIPPLAHSACTIVKLHGDYKDTRIKNTDTELAEYSDKINHLLDRIFDEYGVIVSGWSGTWDLALRNAFFRCGVWRYSTYWTTITPPSSDAQDVIRARKAEILEVSGADSFFEDLLEKVIALEDQRPTQTLSKDLAVATLKRYLPDPQARIRLHDLVTREANRICSELASDTFSVQGSATPQEFRERIERYDSVIEIMESLFAYGFFWDRDPDHPWARTLQRFCRVEVTSGSTAWLNLKRYPAMVLYYASGIASVAAGDYKLFASINHNVKVTNSRGDTLAPCQTLNQLTVFENNVDKWLPGTENKKIPFSVWCHKRMRGTLRDILPDDHDYDDAFDRFEYLTGLLYAYYEQVDFGPAGNFALKGGFRGEAPVIQQTSREIELTDDQWPPLRDGLFRDKEKFLQAKKGYDQHLTELAKQLRW